MDRVLAAIVENDDAGADEICASAKNPAGLELLGDDGETKATVQRLGDPAMLTMRGLEGWRKRSAEEKAALRAALFSDKFADDGRAGRPR